MNMIKQDNNRNEIFHVHTYRCGHAKNIADEVYVKKAIEYGADRITFTDHAPFPGNPFGNRMDIEQLPEYISTIQMLKENYAGTIDVRIGLEIEYLPSFTDYYHRLRENPGIEILMLGQHFYEHEKGYYSFSDSKEQQAREEAAGMGQALVQGMQTGLFDIVAHPDRTFRKKEVWTDELSAIARQIILTADHMGITLEINEKSKRSKQQYWPEFWNLVPETVRTIVGWDIHSLKDMAYYQGGR